MRSAGHFFATSLLNDCQSLELDGLYSFNTLLIPQIHRTCDSTIKDLQTLSKIESLFSKFDEVLDEGHRYSLAWTPVDTNIILLPRNSHAQENDSLTSVHLHRGA